MGFACIERINFLMKVKRWPLVLGQTPVLKSRSLQRILTHLSQVTRRMKRNRHPEEGDSAGAESRTPYSWNHDFILAGHQGCVENRDTKNSTIR